MSDGAEKVGQAMRLLIGAQESVKMAIVLLADAQQQEKRSEQPRVFGAPGPTEPPEDERTLS